VQAGQFYWLGKIGLVMTLHSIPVFLRSVALAALDAKCYFIDMLWDGNNVMRRGFTLLELLLASAMFIVLLGIVWEVTSIFLRAETTRMRQANHQRIVRIWTQMMNDDFRSAIQDTEQLNKAVGGETIRHFGLSGTATQLRIDVSDYSWHSAEASELKTIFYDFQQTSGLVRREQDYAVPKSAEGAIQIAPEIVSGQFRYFDGNAWHDYWASLDRKQIPSAVEVTFYSLPFAEAKRWRDRTSNVRQPVLHRMVVQIPSASQTHFESYKRAQAPKPPEETPLPPPSPPQQPQPQPPPPPSPVHSLFGDH